MIALRCFGGERLLFRFVRYCSVRRVFRFYLFTRLTIDTSLLSALAAHLQNGVRSTQGPWRRTIPSSPLFRASYLGFLDA